MKTQGILRTLLVTTSFCTAVCGMDARNYAGTQDFDLMNPERSFGKQLLTNIQTDIREGLSKDVQGLVELARKASKGDWASVAGAGIHQLIDHFNAQFLRRYNIPKYPTRNDFNPESLKPFLKAFRDKVACLLHLWLAQKGSSYAYNQNTGERYPILSNTPFNELADFFIPDMIPIKNVLISICNTGPINEYLGNKLDELAITCLLKLYKNQTGQTLEEGIAPTILNALKGATDTIYGMITTDHKDHTSLPKLAAEIEPYSPIVDYLQPRLNHFARQVLHSLFLDISQSVKDVMIAQGTKAFLEKPLVIEFAKYATFGLASVGGAAGWSFGGLNGGFVGGLSGSCIGGGMGLNIGAAMSYKLASTLGGEVWGLFGAGIGGLIGAPLGFIMGSLAGGTIGAWSGQAVGASAGFVGTGTFVPRLATYTVNSVARTTSQELDGQIKLLTDYYIYSLLPLTEAEHVLYHLNPEPTPEERAIYYQDYARRDQLLSQTFAGEVIKQFIDLKKFINLEGMFKIIGKIDKQYESFMSYCFSSQDATVKEFWERSGLSADAPINKVKDEKRDKIWRKFVLRTTGQITLSPEDQTLKQNLGTFPSFKEKQQHLNQLSLYMNSLSAKDRKAFTENFHSIKESARAEEERIKKIRQTIDKAGELIEEIYKKEGVSPLNTDSITIIQQSANALWDTATSTQLDGLVEMLQHPDFISNELKEKGEAVIDKDFLKNTLGKYTAKRDEVYLTEGSNQSRFEILKQSSLTESLENADIVALLRKMEQVDPQNLPEKIKELLERGDQERDVISEGKQHELALIKAKYEALLSQQLATKFTRAFNAQFEKIIKEMGQKILKGKTPLSKEALSQRIQSDLWNTQSVQQFMDGISNHPQSELFREKTFSQIKKEILKISKNLLDEEISLEYEFQFIDEESNVQLILAGPEIKELKLYDKYDVGGFELINIINGTFKDKKLDALEESDFETIYEKIQGEKARSLMAEEDIEFLKNYKGEIMAYKMSQLNLANKLFYGYIEIIQDIRKQNQQTLELIQNLKK